jgi:ParB/RepB/Spo0J family partition protein
MSQDDPLSDEAFESQSDAGSAEPEPVATAEAAEISESTGSPFVDRLKQISSDLTGHIPAPDPSVVPSDSTMGRLFAAFFGGKGDISDEALAEFQRVTAEANGTIPPVGSSVVSRSHQAPRLALPKRGPIDRLQRRDVKELLDGQVAPSEPEPVLDVELGQISTEFANMRSIVDEESDATLESSMVALRQFAPLIVARDRTDPNKFILLAGFSRFRIAQKRGWRTVKVLVRALNSEVEAFLINLLENIGHAPVGTYDLAVRCDLIIGKFGLSVAELAQLIAKTPAYVYMLRSLLTSLPANARRDWQARHPAATLHKLAAVCREFDKVSAWEKVRAQHEKAEGIKVLSPSPDIDDEGETEADSSGWEEFKRPTKAQIRRMRDAVSRAKLPADPVSMRELAMGLLDWARGATTKVPHLIALPLKRRSQCRVREEMFPGIRNFG